MKFVVSVGILDSVIVLVVGLLVAEILIGRRGRSSPANSMEYLAKEANTFPAWKLLGVMGAVAGLLIQIGRAHV